MPVNNSLYMEFSIDRPQKGSGSLESRVMDWLRFPMAALVVVNHTGSMGGGSPFPVYSTLCILFPEAICRLAVPLFFLISGYLFFNGLEDWNKEVYLDKMKRRSRSLLVPYILWNLLAVLFFYSYSAFRMHMKGEAFMSFSEQLQEWGWLRVFWDCDKGLPLNYSLWYIRDLILFVIASPLIHFVLKKIRWVGIAILGALFLIFNNVHFLGGLLFFSLGCCLRICGKSILELSRKVRWPALILSCLLLPAIVLTYRDYRPVSNFLMRVFILSGVFSVFFCASVAYRARIIRDTPFLARCSFFIFAAHGILIINEFAHYIVLHTLPLQGEAYYCVDLFLRPAIAIAMCIALYWLMSKIMPRTLDLLTGGRAKPRTASA